MTFLKSFLAVVLSAAAGLGAAILAGMVFPPLAFPILVLLVTLAIYHRKNLVLSASFWSAILGYVSYIAMMILFLRSMSLLHQ